MKMEQTECSETSTYKIQMPENCPEESIQYVILITFPPQQWLRERTSLLRYMYIACLVWECVHEPHEINRKGFGKMTSISFRNTVPEFF